MSNRSGILLPVSALPAKDIGNFGEVALLFLDQCRRAGQSVWQVLPLGPTIIHDSPFYSPSAFAISPNYIDLDDLVSREMLIAQEVEEYLQKFSREDPNRIAYGKLWDHKLPLLRKAFARFLEQSLLKNEAYFHFVEKYKPWLDNFSNFMGIKEVHLHRPDRATWMQWDDEFKHKWIFDGKMAEYRRMCDENKRTSKIGSWKLPEGWTVEKVSLFNQIEYQANFHKFLQWIALEQWLRLKKAAGEKGMRIIGDCPIYVSPDSADVWANRDVFKLDEQGEQRCFAGVPPDYFSPKHGQFWGNPIYKWLANEKKKEWNMTAFAWWAKRLRHQLELFDELRIDHFRGFAGYWEVPRERCEIAGEKGETVKTAKFGKWIPGPGLALFEYVAKEFGMQVKDMPIIAEDLGVITPDVTAVRVALNAPGMGVFQFAPWAEAFYMNREKRIVPVQSIQEIEKEGIRLDTKAGWERMYYCADSSKGEYLPFLSHEFLPENAKTSGKSVFYPGTHDNETIIGWFHDLEKTDLVRYLFVRYLEYAMQPKYTQDCQNEPINWKVIRALSCSGQVSHCIFQMQDVLGLPNEDERRGIKIRTNIPNQKGQWQWKMGGEHVFKEEIQQKLCEITRHNQRT